VTPTATPTPTATAGRSTGGGGTGAGFGPGTTRNTLAETGSDATGIIVFGSVVLLAGIALAAAVGIRRRHQRPGTE